MRGREDEEQSVQHAKTLKRRRYDSRSPENYEDGNGAVVLVMDGDQHDGTGHGKEGKGGGEVRILTTKRTGGSARSEAA